MGRRRIAQHHQHRERQWQTCQHDSREVPRRLSKVDALGANGDPLREALVADMEATRPAPVRAEEAKGETGREG